jgi:hypothetical protein
VALGTFRFFTLMPSASSRTVRFLASLLLVSPVSWRKSLPSFLQPFATYQMIALALTPGVNIRVDIEHALFANDLARQSQIFRGAQEERAIAELPPASALSRLGRSKKRSSKLEASVCRRRATSLVSILVDWQSPACISLHSTADLPPLVLRFALGTVWRLGSIAMRLARTSRFSSPSILRSRVLKRESPLSPPSMNDTYSPL